MLFWIFNSKIQASKNALPFQLPGTALIFPSIFPGTPPTIRDLVYIHKKTNIVCGLKQVFLFPNTFTYWYTI